MAEKGFYIGNVYIPNRVILAPMAGVTDVPYRVLCAEQGAGMNCMEMVSAKAIFYGNKGTEELLKIDDREGVVSLQLFGSDPQIISDMAQRIEDRPFSILDINMGCPVKKIVDNHEGSALMKNPTLAGKIIEEVVKKINKPVTVKFRKGYDEANVNAVSFAHVAQESGAAAVAVHGRTKTQMYAGKADWDIIRQVKEAVSIPVIGNGDVVDGPTAKRMMDETGCDAVMVGRAAQGDPWIFSRIGAFLDRGEMLEKASFPEVCEMIMRHAKMLVEEKGDHIGIREMRKHVAWYISGHRNAAEMRRSVNYVENIEELQGLIDRALSNGL
ncbi:MAG: tRNA dihydrouridine synthase DusB [Lachnospiraceae bacterium]|nr:tRNA dihydrouridine synthase DusB [Candidatus Merdinaster equi]